MSNATLIKFDSKLTSIEDALDAANLNFITESSELLGATSGLVAPDHKMLYRPDTNQVLGIVGRNYQPIQNSLAMAFMDVIVQEHGFTYKKAISRNNGATSVIVAESERTTAIRVGDEVSKEIKLVNGFDGKNGFSVEFSMMRLVCLNGMVKPEKESAIKFKHTINVESRMETALKVFNKSINIHEQFIAQSKALAQKALDKAMVEEFLNNLWPSESNKNDKKKERILEIAHTGKGNTGNTMWDLYNGVTEWVDHYASKDENRTDYANFGSGVKLKEKAWNLANTL